MWVMLDKTDELETFEAISVKPGKSGVYIHYKYHNFNLLRLMILGRIDFSHRI